MLSLIYGCCHLCQSTVHSNLVHVSFFFSHGLHDHRHCDFVQVDFLSYHTIAGAYVTVVNVVAAGACVFSSHLLTLLYPNLSLAVALYFRYLVFSILTDFPFSRDV